MCVCVCVCVSVCVFVCVWGGEGDGGCVGEGSSKFDGRGLEPVHGEHEGLKQCF